jgi:carbonic anhydrase/acetyltransferase-like protein (isoleucine patch superfamily)
MGSTILNGAHIGKHCLVGAGSLVTEGKVFPDGSMIMGSPAKVVKALTQEQILGLQKAALGYIDNAKRFAQTLVALPEHTPDSTRPLGSTP